MSLFETEALILRTYNLLYFQEDDGIRGRLVTVVQTCALPISARPRVGDRQRPRRRALPQAAARRDRRRREHGDRRLLRSEERRVGKECGTESLILRT